MIFSMTYWLDLFTGQTWQEFRDYGATVSGFRKRMHNAVNRIKPGDVLLCYLTGRHAVGGSARSAGTESR